MTFREMDLFEWVKFVTFVAMLTVSAWALMRRPWGARATAGDVKLGVLIVVLVLLIAPIG